MIIDTTIQPIAADDDHERLVATRFEMLWRGAKRQLIAGITVVGCLGIAAMAQSSAEAHWIEVSR